MVVSLLVFVVLFSVITIVGYFFLDSILKEQIQRSVYKSSRGQYTLQIRDLSVDVWTGNVRFKDLKLVQDTVVLRRLKKNNPEQNFPKITLSASSASIRHFRWLNYIVERDLKVGKIVINEPDLKVVGEDPSESLKSTNKNFIELLPAIIAGFAGSLRIEELVVNEGKVNYKAYDEDGLIAQNADGVFIDITEVNIDTVSQQRLLYSDDIVFNLKNYTLRNSKRQQVITIAEIDASLSDSTFQLLSFTLGQEGKTELNHSDIFIHEISGVGVDFKSFLYGKHILMDKLLIDKPNVNLVSNSKDKNTGEDKNVLPGKIMVPDIITEILQSFNVNLITVQNGTIKNKLIGAGKETNQSAKNVNIEIAKIVGKTLDSLQLSSPEQISMSFTDYKLVSSKPYINLNLKTFNGSTATGALRMNNLHVIYEEKNIDGTSEKVTASMKSAIGSGFNFKTVLDQDKVVLNSFTLNTPKLDIITSGNKNSGKKIRFNGLINQSLPDNISEFIKSFEIQNITVKNGSLNALHVGIENPVTQRIGKLDGTINRLYTDTPGKPINFHSVVLSVSDYFLQVGEQRFSLEVPSVEINSLKNSAVFNNVKLVQDHPPEKEANHYTVKIPKISSLSIDVKKALREGMFIAKRVDVNQLRGEFLMHKLRPEYAEKMPNELISELNFYFRFDTVNFQNAFVSHTDATGELTTVITFENSAGKLVNLTNDRNLMSLEKPAIFHFSTYILGQGKLDATVRIPLLGNNFSGGYSGNFSGMSGLPFNNALRPADIQIESGVVDSAYFNVGINNGEAEGIVGFLYRDLDVEVLSSDGDKSRLKSLLGNFVIKNSNPDDPGDEPEIVVVDASRNEHDSFFFFLWRPVLEGIVKTVTKGRFLPDAFTEK